MTTPNAVRLQEFFDLVGRGEMPAALAYIHPSCVINEAAGLPYGGDYIGGEGFVGLFGAIARDFEMTVDSSEIVCAAGNSVIAEMSATFRGKRSGRTLDDMRIIEHYVFADGLLTKIDVFYKDTKAVADLLADEGSAVGAAAPR